MADVPQVGITNGVPTSGTGTVQTISTITDRLPAALGSGGGLKVDGSGTALPVSGTVTANLAAGNNNVGDVDVASVPTDPFGANADAASATGSFSAKLRGIATALGITAFDLAPGTGGSRTLRVAVDTSQVAALGQAAMSASMPVAIANNQSSVKTVSGGSEYETVAAGQTDQILGPTGGQGDYLEGLLCVVATAATSQVQIKDGNGSAITVLPNNVGAGVGSYYVPLGLISVNGTTPGWKVTTAAGVSVIGMGDFT